MQINLTRNLFINYILIYEVWQISIIKLCGIIFVYYKIIAIFSAIWNIFPIDFTLFLLKLCMYDVHKNF